MVNTAPRPIRIDASAEYPSNIRRRHRHHLAVDTIAVIVVLAAAWLIAQITTSPNFGWPDIAVYLFDPRILNGVLTTLVITILAMIIAIALGLVLAMMRLSKNRILVAVSWVYVWFFRSVPLLVLLLVVYNISVLIPRLSVGVPFGPALFSVSTSDLVNGFIAGVLVFGLQEAAYTSETLRSALVAVPIGQTEAAMAIGMRPWQRLSSVVFPQALRIAVPPLANDTITLMKSTSLLAFIAVADLLYSAQEIYAQNYRIIPLLMVATVWYVVLVSVLSLGQTLLENYLRTGSVQILRRSKSLLPKEAQ
ncbi:amino acid ABC transporter permease [soil metagenome]